jgi:MFS family permease
MKQEELLDANAISSVITNIAMVISPIIAGLLFSKFGILVILFANSISFILSAIGELFINIPKIEKHAGKLSGKSYLQDLKEGLKFTVSQRDVLSIMLVALVANFALNPITNMGFTYVLKENLKCSNSQVGLFQTIMLAGMFIAPIVSTTILKNTSINKIITINMSLCGVFIVATALLVSPLYLSLFDNNLIPYVSIIIIVILIAIFITIINIFLGTMFQKKVPLTMLGRVGAVLNTIGAAMTPLGQMVFGILFDVQAAFICFIIAGVIVLLSVLLYTIINRKTKEAEENVSEVIS